MKIDNNTKFLIIGLGLIGGSYAQGLTKAGYEVGAIDAKQSSVDFAVKHNYISHGTTMLSKEYIEKFDVIIFALYPKIFIQWIKDNQSFFKPGAILTDVTGVKCSVVYKIQDALRDDLEFIGAHPMAGREVYGVENANAEIFHNANYIVTPTEKNSENAIECCKKIGEILKFGKISTLSPEEHDEMIGFLSQLTHCIAVALMTSKESEHLVDYTGDSFRDLTRIAKINEDMWSELFFMNKDKLLAQMDLFTEKFKFIKECLQNNDTDSLKEIMRESTKRRKYFDK